LPNVSITEYPAFDVTKREDVKKVLWCELWRLSSNWSPA